MPPKTDKEKKEAAAKDGKEKNKKHNKPEPEEHEDLDGKCSYIAHCLLLFLFIHRLMRTHGERGCVGRSEFCLSAFVYERKYN